MVEIVTKLNIESAPHNNVIDYLNNPSLVRDPRSPNATTRTRTFVYDSDPLMKSINFGFLPYIIVRGPSIIYSNISTDGKFKVIRWSHSITVRTARDGSANTRQDVGRKDMQDICNDLQQLFNEEVNKQSLRQLNMYAFNFAKETGDDTLIIQQKQLLECNYELSYNTRIRVSQ